MYILRKVFGDNGSSIAKIEDFFLHLYECIHECSQIVEPIYDDDNEYQEGEKKSEVKKLKRFEDKYLEEYKKLEDIELNQEKLDSLKNNIVMENTPIGNVIMFYDNKKGTFVFYSDLTMPYRYLEVVGRKYVITFNCKKLFVDMKEELMLAEEKKIKKQETDAAISCNENQNTSSFLNQVKKDVFVKFKSYNNNVTKDVVAAASKNAGTITKKENANFLLKENANRYRYEGKFANFNFLRPVDKKQTDKRLAMSWSDYKNIAIIKKIETKNEII